jgi:hypothetical protein
MKTSQWAGLRPLIISINLPNFDLNSTSEFWWYYTAVMTNSAIVTTIPPFAYFEPDCISYFLPNELDIIEPDLELLVIGKRNYTDANALIVNDAPGYQIEYAVPSHGFVLDEEDCRVYGIPGTALQICVKQNENSLLGGI